MLPRSRFKIKFDFCSGTLVSLHNAQIFRLLLKISVERSKYNESNLYFSCPAKLGRLKMTIIISGTKVLYP